MIRAVLLLTAFAFGVMTVVVMAQNSWYEIEPGTTLGILFIAAFLLMVCKVVAWGAPPKESR